MPAPYARNKEKDLSTRVSSLTGVPIAIVIKAKKGEINVGRKVTNETQFLKYFTPDDTIKVGYDLGYYSVLAALSQSNDVTVVRAASNAMYGGSLIPISGSSKSPSQASQITFKASAMINNSANVTVSDIMNGNINSLLNKYIFLGNFGKYRVISVNETDNRIVLNTPLSSAALLVVSESMTVQSTNISFTVSGFTEGSAVLTVNTFNLGSLNNVVGKTITSTTIGTATILSANEVAGTITISADITGSNFPINEVATVVLPPLTLTASSIVLGATQITYSNLTPNSTDLIVGRKVTASTGEYTISNVTPTTLTFTEGIKAPAMPTNVNCYVNGFTDPTAVLMGNEDAFTLYPSSEGIWGDDIYYTIVTEESVLVDSQRVFIKEPSANKPFLIRVFKSTNRVTPIEEHLVSRIQGQTDGYGNNIYIEDKLKSSNYIRAIDNLSIDEQVLPKEILVPVQIRGGSDGDMITDTAMIKAASFFMNKSRVQVKLILDAGHTTKAYQSYLDSIASSRGDCVAILSTRYQDEVSSDYLTEMVNYRNNELNLDSSYSAMIGPHVAITDKYNNRDIFVAPDGYLAGAIAYSASVAEIWYPPAGQTRGKLNINDLSVRFDTGEMDSLYDAGINPIYFNPGQGIYINGQKTMLARPSALDRLNTRLMLIVVEPAILTSLKSFLFEINDEGTRAVVRAMIQSYMEGVKARKGVYDFYVVCDKTNNSDDDIDNYILNVHLFVKPTKSIEYIEMTTVITRTGMDFKLAQTAI